MYCKYCGKEIKEAANFCPHCGQAQAAIVSQTMPQQQNTSGQGRQAVIPNEIRGWNWGAFLLPVIWGAWNNVWWWLLLLIPYFDIIWILVMGAKGSEWAWRSKRWDSVEHFKRTQKKWRNWAIGLTVFWVFIVLIILIAADFS